MLEPSASDIEYFDDAINRGGNVGLFSIGLKYPGFVNWSVDPPGGIHFLDPPAQNTIETLSPIDGNRDFSGVLFRACRAGSYTMTATYVPERCNIPPIVKTLPFTLPDTVEPRAPDGVNVVDLFGDSLRVFTLRTSHPGRTEWSIEPSDQIRIVSNSGETVNRSAGPPELDVAPDDPLFPHFSDLYANFCQAGQYTATVRYIPEDCPEDAFTSSVTIDISEAVAGCDDTAAPLLENEVPRILQQTEPTVVAGGRFYYLLVNQANQRERRGIAGSRGIAHPDGLRMAPLTDYEEYLLDADTLEVARATWRSPVAGRRFTLPDFLFEPVLDQPDTDMDGLHDLAERIVGTNPNHHDSDGDGRPDGSEVLGNSDPLDNVPARTGIVANLQLPGETLDVCTVGDFALTANGAAGVCIVNIFNGLAPVFVGQADTAGHALQVACDRGYAAVADTHGGLAIIQLAEPANESRLLFQVPFDEGVSAVEAAGGLAFAGLGNGQIVAVELATGQQVAEVSMEGGAVQDLTLGGSRLLAVTKSNLGILSLPGQPIFALLEERAYDTISGPSLHLFAGDDFLFLTHREGYATYTFDGVSFPTQVSNEPTNQFGWRQTIADGNGLALAAVGANSTNDGEHDISIYDVTDLENTNDFVTEIDTPGLASGLDLANGLAYVADRLEGLQVLNYAAADFANNPPTIELSHNFKDGEAEENATLLLTARCSDDVQIRQVEFFLNNVRLGADGKFPFEWRLRVPSKNLVPKLEIAARVSDTAGNTAEAELTLQVVSDATAPRVLWVTPIDGAEIAADSETVFSVRFTEPLDRESFSPNEALAVFSAGVDGQLETADDEVINGRAEYIPALQTLTFSPSRLPGGLYRASLAGGYADRAGNTAADFSWSFTVPGPKIVSRFPRQPQRPYQISQIFAVADRNVAKDSLTNDGFRLVKLAEEGAPMPISGQAVFSLQDAAQVIYEVSEQLTPGQYEASLQGLKDEFDGTIPPFTWRFAISPATPIAFTPGTNTIAPNGITEASIRFDTALDPGTIGNLTLHLGNVDGPVVPAAPAIYVSNENRILMRFTDPLIGGQDYSWRLREGLLDFQGRPVERRGVYSFTVDAKPTYVRGELVNADGTPLPNALVTLRYEDALGRERTEILTSNVDGTFGGSVTAFRQVTVTARMERLVSEVLSLRPVTMVPVEDGVTDFGVLTLSPLFEGVLDGGHGHVLWIDRERKLQAFGTNAFGQLGTGEIGGQQFQPQPVGEEGLTWNDVSAGFTHSAAIDTNGGLWTWGSNERGQLGNGTLIAEGVPQQVLAEQAWREVEAGTWYTVAIREDGTLWGWGHAPHGKVTGQLREVILTPQQIGSDSDWMTVSAGRGHVLALKSDGSLWGWGGNGDGQLGDGTQTDKAQPARIGIATDWVKITAGDSHSFGIGADGSLWAWGLNLSNKLGAKGLSGIEYQLEPVRVGDEFNWAQVAAAGDHSLARQTDGSVWFWGNVNEANVPGVNRFSALAGPQPVHSWAGAVFVATGQGNNLSVNEAGQLLTSGFGRGAIHALSHTSPTINAQSPYGMGVNQVRLNFFGDIDPASVTPDTIQLKQGTGFASFNIPYAASFASGTSQVILNLERPLRPFVNHSIIVTGDVRDAIGRDFAGALVNQFMVDRPLLSSVFPSMEVGAKIPFPDVDRLEIRSVSGFKPDTVDAETITLANIGIDGQVGTEDDIAINGEIQLNDAEDRLTLRLAEPLPVGDYVGQVGDRLLNAHGHDFRFSSNFGVIPIQWHFSVNEGPEVLRTDPELQFAYGPFDQAKGLTEYKITFTHTEMDEFTINRANIQLRQDTPDGPAIAPQELIYSPDTRTVTLTFDPPILDGNYFITLSDEVQDLKGRRLQNTEPIPLEVKEDQFAGGT